MKKVISINIILIALFGFLYYLTNILPEKLPTFAALLYITDNKTLFHAHMFLYFLPILVFTINIFFLKINQVYSKQRTLMLLLLFILSNYFTCYFLHLYIDKGYTIFQHPRGAPFPIYLLFSLIITSLLFVGYLLIYPSNKKKS